MKVEVTWLVSVDNREALIVVNDTHCVSCAIDHIKSELHLESTQIIKAEVVQ